MKEDHLEYGSGNLLKGDKEKDQDYSVTTEWNKHNIGDTMQDVSVNGFQSLKKKNCVDIDVKCIIRIRNKERTHVIHSNKKFVLQIINVNTVSKSVNLKKPIHD